MQAAPRRLSAAGGEKTEPPSGHTQSPLPLLSLPTALRKARGRAWRRSHGAPRRRPFKPEPGAAAADKMAAPGGAEAEGVGASPAPPLLPAEPPAAPGLARGPHRGGMAAPPLSPTVSVVFPGAVSRESCCRFACELLKHVLYQRHQLPLPYEQLAYFCRRPSQVGAGFCFFILFYFFLRNSANITGSGWQGSASCYFYPLLPQSALKTHRSSCTNNTSKSLLKWLQGGSWPLKDEFSYL